MLAKNYAYLYTRGVQLVVENICKGNHQVKLMSKY